MQNSDCCFTDPELHGKFSRVRLLAMDVDGVLTDGSLYYGPEGEVVKAFYARDGMGITLLHRAGFRTVFISGRDSQAVQRRGRELGVTGIYLGISNKPPLVRELAAEFNLELQQVAFIGDDLNDLGVLEIVGLGIAPSNAPREVRTAADYVTEYPGGRGAVREVTELILRAGGLWMEIIQKLRTGADSHGTP